MRLKDLGLYLLSRVFIAAVFIGTAQLGLVPQKFPEGTVNHPGLRVDPVAATAQLSTALRLTDSGWYVSIAEYGYEEREFSADRNANWAFFPLLPIVERVLFPIFGDWHLAGFCAANIFTIAAFMMLRFLLERRGEAQGTISRAIFFLAFFPTTYFLNVPITESSFLFLTLAAFAALEAKRPVLAGSLMMLVTACRPTGFLVLPAFLLTLKRTLAPGSWWQLFAPKTVVALGLAPLGLAAFMTHLYQVTGNAFAFADIQIAWGRQQGEVLKVFRDLARDPLLVISDWNFVTLNLGAAVLIAAAAVHFIRRREFDLATYLAFPLAAALNSGTLYSLGRFALALFPVFIYLGRISEKRSVELALTVVFSGLLVVCTILFALRVTAALA